MTRECTGQVRELLDAGWTQEQVLALSPSAVVVERHPTTGEPVWRTSTRAAGSLVDTAVERVRARAEHANPEQGVIEAMAQAVLPPGERLSTQKQIKYILALQGQCLRAGEGGGFIADAHILPLERLRTMTTAQASQIIDSLRGDY